MRCTRPAAGSVVMMAGQYCGGRRGDDWLEGAAVPMVGAHLNSCSPDWNKLLLTAGCYGRQHLLS